MPGMFSWGYLRSALTDAEPTVYRCDGIEVARLTRRVTGGWVADLNQHLDHTDPRRRSRDCQSLETGRVGVEEWGAAAR